MRAGEFSYKVSKGVNLLLIILCNEKKPEKAPCIMFKMRKILIINLKSSIIILELVAKSTFTFIELILKISTFS